MAVTVSGIRIDPSDFAEVLAKIRDVAQRLSPPQRDKLIKGVFSLAETNQCAIVLTTKKHSLIELIASAELIDLLRQYDPVKLPG